MRRAAGAGFGNRSLRGSAAGAGGVSSEPSGRRRRVVGFRARASLPFAGDQFAALGLTPAATKSDVKRAYKRLALKYHPDVIRDRGGAQEKDAFREIKSAYESLMAKFEEDDSRSSSSSSIVADGGGLDDEWEEWDEWMGFEGGFPVLYTGS